MKRTLLLDASIIAWCLVAMVVGLGIVISIPAYFSWFTSQSPLQNFNSIDVILNASSGLASLVTAAISFGLAVVLYVRKRDDRMALFVSYFLLGYGLIMAGPLEMIEYWLFGEIGIVSSRAQMIFTLPVFFLLLTFPSGTVKPVQLRWLSPLIPVVLFLMLILSSNELDSISTLRSQILFILLGILTLVLFIGQVYRYLKISTPQQRQQTKLVIFGIGMWLLFLGISSVPYYIYINNPAPGARSIASPAAIIWWLGLLILPVSLTLAVIRSHLWDIDVIIRRTLVYSIMTALLTGVYFGSVVIFQALFSLLGSQRSPAVIVISTLLIAALFTPLRRRIQGLIDRRFYRKRYDAQQTLQAFSVALKNEIDLEQMAELLVGVVEEAIEPENVSLWIREVKKG